MRFPEPIDIKIVSVQRQIQPIPGEVIIILPEEKAWERVERYGGEAHYIREGGTLHYVTRFGKYTLGFKRPNSVLEPQYKKGWAISVEINGKIVDGFTERDLRPTDREIYLGALEYALRQREERALK